MTAAAAGARLFHVGRAQRPDADRPGQHGQAASPASTPEHTDSASERRKEHPMKTANAKIVPVVADSRSWKFTASTAALDGHVFPATYSVARTSGDVYVFASIGDTPVRIHIGRGMPTYHEALEAAMAAKNAPKQPAKQAEPAAKPAEPAKPAKQAAPKAKAKQPAKQAEPAAKPAEPAKPAKQAAPKAKAKQPAKQAEPAAKPAEPAKPAKQAAPKAKAEQPAKQAAGADRSWVGTALTGKGWHIAFDEATQRTRVVFDADPSASQKAAIEAAGFYWSATTKSWNKKLTQKAHRAAIALAETLNALA